MSATKDARIKELEAEVSEATQARDDYRAKLEAAEAQATEATGQRDDYAAQLEKTGEELLRTVGERDLLQEQYAALEAVQAESSRQLTAFLTPGAATGPEASTEPAEADPHAEVKAALILNKLERAYVLPGGDICFDETHARKFAGEAFDTLTVISAE